jgi:hypothetical protein
VGVEFIRYHTCATEVQSGMRRSYDFGCNFGMGDRDMSGKHDADKMYPGAPLQEVIYGLNHWPHLEEKILGPIMNESPAEKERDLQSLNEPRDREIARTRKALENDPDGEECIASKFTLPQCAKFENSTDPCSGERIRGYDF